MGVQIRPRAGGLGEVAMTGQCIGLDAEILRSPGERHGSSVELRFRYRLLIEVPFAQHQEMTGGVVVGGGVAGALGAPQFVDVAIAVDGDVIRDVDPTLLILVISLILSQASWRISVVAEHNYFVMQSHPGDGV